MAYYRCGPTAIGSRASWSVTSPVDSKTFDRPLSGNYDRIFNAFERTNAFEYVRSTFEGKPEERQIGHEDIVVNRKMSSSFERADCALAAQTPCDDDEEFYREKILYSQARQLFPLQEDLADWINKTIGKCNFGTRLFVFPLILLSCKMIFFLFRMTGNNKVIKYNSANKTLNNDSSRLE